MSYRSYSARLLICILGILVSIGWLFCALKALILIYESGLLGIPSTGLLMAILLLVASFLGLAASVGNFYVLNLLCHGKQSQVTDLAEKLCDLSGIARSLSHLIFGSAEDWLIEVYESEGRDDDAEVVYDEVFKTLPKWTPAHLIRRKIGSRRITMVRRTISWLCSVFLVVLAGFTLLVFVAYRLDTQVVPSILNELKDAEGD